MERPVPSPCNTDSYSKTINNNSNNKLEIKLKSYQNILSLVTDLKEKKYRLVISQEELQNCICFFKQFSTLEQILSAIEKIISLSNNVIINEKEIIIKFKDFLDKEFSIKIPEDKNDIDLLFLKLKKLEIEIKI